MIEVEATTRTALATCSSCPPWRELRGTREAALTAAAAHVQQTHGDYELAAKLRRRARDIETRRGDKDAE